MGKKKAKGPTKPEAEPSAGGWTINSQSAIVTIWESRSAAGGTVYAVTFNRNREPVPPADDVQGASSVMLAFQKLERADNLKERDSHGAGLVPLAR